MRKYATILGLIAAVLLLGGSGPVLKAPTVEATFPGTNGRIVYVFDGGTGSDLWTMPPDGTDKKQVHTNIANPSEPRWSADGNKIAFVSFGATNQIHIIDADGQNIQTLPMVGDNPSWSPDGKKIAYYSTVTGSTGIWVATLDGSAPPVIVHASGIHDSSFRPEWSPDGTVIEFVAFTKLDSHGDGINDIYVIPATGGAPQKITSITDEAGDFQASPVWFADGTRFLTAQHTPQASTKLKIVSYPGGAITPVDITSYRATPSPDGTQVVYQGQDNHLHVQNISGGAALDVSGGAVTPDRPDWAPVGGPLSGIEFTQAAQTLQPVKALEDQVTDHKNTPIPIVAGKMAVMRLYFNAVTQATDFRVHTTLGDYGGSAVDANVHLEPGCTATQRRDNANNCYSTDFYFVPPEGDWSTPVSISDSGDHAVYTHDFHFTSARSVPLTIVTVPVCDYKILASWICPNDSAVDGLTGLLRAVAPTDSVTVVHGPTSIYLATDTADSAWWSSVVAQISALALTNPLGLSGRVVWVGVVRPDQAGSIQGTAFFQPAVTLFGNDVSVAVMKTATRAFGQANTDQNLARLVARSMGLNYSNTAEPATSSPPGCYATALDSNSDWIVVTNKISSTGFDVLSGDAKPGDKFLELMGYCSPSWVSEHTYLALLDKLKTGLFSSAAVPAAADASWAVSGSINGQAATLEPLFTVDTPSSGDAGTGAYRIEVHSAGGSVLFARNFDATASSPEPADGQPSVPGPAQFAQLIGVQPGAERIVVLQGNTELGSIDLTGAAPTVTFASQPAASGQQSITWTIADTDSTTFTSSLDFSTDGGATWQPVAVGLPDSELTVDFDQLAGSANAMLRVRVSDGAHTGEATTGPFAVGEKGPKVSIVSPGDGALIHAGQFAALQAAASDAEDGTLTGGALSWSSSIDGPLGTGASLPVATLSPGTHVITLTGHDSANNTASDTITLTVWDAALIEGQANGDVDCDFSVTVLDALGIELKAAGTPRTQPVGCADIGSGSPEFGDVDCSGSLDAPDVIDVLRYVVGRPAPPPGGCRPVGS